MRTDRSGQVDERVDLLQLTRPRDGQEAFDSTFPIIAAGTKHDLSPLHGSPERALGGVIRRLDPVLMHEGEEVLILHEERRRQIPDVVIRRVEMPLAERKEPLFDRQDFRDQFVTGERRAAGGGIVAKPMPETKQPAVERECFATETLGRRRVRQVQRAEQVPREMRLTELPLAGRVREIAGQAIAAEHAGEARAQQRLQYVRPARRGNSIEDERARDERPEPPFLAVGAVACFIRIDDRFVRQRRFEFRIRGGDGRTGFFPRGLRAAQTHRNLQSAFQDALHDEARHSTDHRQIGNQRGELRTELTHDLVGQRRLRRLSAPATSHAMAPIFSDVRLERRQFGDLMAPGIADVGAGMQGVVAMATSVGDHVDDRVDALSGHQGAPVARMARLPTWFAAALQTPTSFTLPPGQTVGGWRL